MSQMKPHFISLVNFNSKPLNVNGHGFLISASVGMNYAGPGKDLKVLLNEADMAMYEAKRNGRSTLRVHFLIL